MAKKGMKRIDRTHIKANNEVSPVPEINGKAKSGHVRANPFIAGTQEPYRKVYHAKPHA